MDLQSIHKIFDLNFFSLFLNGLLCIGVCSVALKFAAVAKSWINLQRKKPPGPIGLPVLGYLPFLGPEPHKTLRDMRQKFGDIIGLYMGTKYTVILNEFTVMKEVLCNTAALDRASNLFDHIPEIGFITKNGEEWQEQRRFCLSATRDLGLGRGHWEDLVMDEVSCFTDYLSSSKGLPVDVSHTLATSISSNIISLLIGRRLKKVEEAEKVQLSVNYSEVSFTFMGPSCPTSLVPGLRKLCETLGIAGYDKAKKIINDFQRFVRDEISKHKKTQINREQDFINIYLDKLKEMHSSENTRHYFSDAMLEGNLKILFLGSSDTIFSSIGWMLRLMAQHQDIQDRVRSELMEVLGKDGRVLYEERHKIPYTFAVIMEMERYASIVPLSTTRRTNQDFQVRGHIIPKGSDVAANLWALHHDPAYWKEPGVFEPMRFLTEDGTRLAKQPASYAPFSIGRRNCPGETIAWMEILAYSTEILRRFRVTAPPGVELKFIEVNGLVAHLEPQPLCFNSIEENS